MDTHALLLTGPPGIGKTTVIRRVAAALAGRRLRGFTTEEIRCGPTRVGFRLGTFDGGSAVLAHVDHASRERVGRYGVDVAALDALAGVALAPDDPGAIYLVDEIGKMECLSGRFAAAVVALLEAGRTLVATVALRGGGLIEEVKRRRGVELLTLTYANREAMPARILSWLTPRLRV